MGFTMYLAIIYLFLFIADVFVFIKGIKEKNDTFYSDYCNNNY